MNRGDLDVAVRTAIDKIGDKRGDLEAAFRTCNFVYGTQGSNIISKVIAKFVGGLEAKAAREKIVTHDPAHAPARLKNVFDPGFRARAYVHGVNSQMMDLYYGQSGTDTYKERNPLIGEYVHRAMGFTGAFNMKVPGYEAYWNTFGRVPSPKASESWHPGPFYEGWETPAENPNGRKRYGDFFYPDPDKGLKAGMTATKYMSRAIRQGIAYFGGTLIYDGAEVYYESVFSTRAGVRDSDTAMEARALLPHFAMDRGKSRVAFGNGAIVFHWFGKEVVPTRALFKENWIFAPGGATHRPANALAAFKGAEQFSDLWWRFPEDHPRNASRKARLSAAADWAKEQVAAHPQDETVVQNNAAKALQRAWRLKVQKKKGN